ncbi:hypothetical protein HC766_03670 [Candidatus Gracilibacteria bacterium]|nr:hypothetical protein [Candidatus Gracilibacteria bacterium]
MSSKIVLLQTYIQGFSKNLLDSIDCSTEDKNNTLEKIQKILQKVKLDDDYNLLIDVWEIIQNLNTKNIIYFDTIAKIFLEEISLGTIGGASLIFFS